MPTVIPQQPTRDLDMQTAVAEMEEKLPGLLGYLEPDNPGMHTTDTIDFEVVLSGEVILELDDGPRRCCARATPWCKTGRGTAGATGEPSQP